MHLNQFPRHSDCTSCELHTIATSVGIPTIYLPDSQPPSAITPAVVFIGQNPGFHEDQCGEPFVGRSGALLRGGWINTSTGAPAAPNSPDSEHVEGAYIDGVSLRSLASIYVTNVCRCYTKADDKPGWKAHIKPCFPHTAADLLAICAVHSPAPICLMLISAPAVEAIYNLLLSDKRISQKESFKRNGAQFTIQGHPQLPLFGDGKGDSPAYPAAPSYTINVFSTFHPAHALRELNNIAAVESHMQLLANFLNGLAPSVSSPILSPIRPPRTM